MLNLSSKGRYATRIMVFLACRNDETPARKQEIAEAEDITGDYVEQILIKLKSAGLVKSRRGANGGFLLAVDAGHITVADVLAATEGSINIAPCLTELCPRASQCVTRQVWQKASDALGSTFSDVTIRELARQASNLQLTKSWSYEI
jgi:Rrf2 family transcriptional regulator, iron-sulfur cluster assembly transcription factor